MKRKMLLNLYMEMKRQGVTQRMVAKAAGVSQVTISQRINCHWEESGYFSELQKYNIRKLLIISENREAWLFEEVEL